MSVGKLFRAALRENAAAFIVTRNHSGSDSSPSPEDVRITRKIKDVGELMDIRVPAHISLSNTDIEVTTAKDYRKARLKQQEQGQEDYGHAIIDCSWQRPFACGVFLDY